MLNKLPRLQMSLGTGLKNLLRTPLNIMRDMNTPSGNDSGTIGTTNMAFDEVAQEWSSVITEAPYELANSQSLDVVGQNNFGTIDNPNVIFAGDIPFRFVGCAGQPNEDDFDGHELMIFLLREGPLQRCAGCGQVFKLVRLRNEHSETGQYYLSSLIGQDVEEMGEADHFMNFNPIRGTLMNSHDHTMFEVQSNFVYSLANPEDHDRFLVDPAYRLDKIKEMEHKHKVYADTMREIDRDYEEQHGAEVTKMSKQRYENVVNAEIAIQELDDHMNKVHRFNLRHMYDMDNHKRREERMMKRHGYRLKDTVTAYVNGFTEEELMYNDYFETDLELEVEEQRKSSEKVKSESLTSKAMRQENVVFHETWTDMPEPDSQPLVQQKIFRFKYREALSTAEDHERRENRMIDRANENLPAVLEKYQKYVNLEQEDHSDQLESPSYVAKVKVEKQFFDALFDFNIKNYESYFESDFEEDMALIHEMPNETKLAMLDGLYLDSLNEYFGKRRLSHFSFAKREDEEEGYWSRWWNLLSENEQQLEEMQDRIDLYDFAEEKEELELKSIEDKGRNKKE